jgi:hypothetical protein
MKQVACSGEHTVQRVMARGFTTTKQIRGKEPLLRHLVCEVRYQDGQLYLDRCGRALRTLAKIAPDWVIATEPSVQGTTLYHLHDGLQLNFSRVGASLSLDKSSADEVINPEEQQEFFNQIELALGTILDELEVTEFSRVGYREYYYFPFDGKEESEKWLQELGIVTIAPGVYETFAAAPDALGIAIVMQGADCRYRIGLNGIERAAQVPVGDTLLNVRPSAAPKGQRQALLASLKKQRQRQINTAFAVVLDIDAFLLDPEGEVDVRTFVEEQAPHNLQRFREALPKEPPKKGK